MEEEKVEETIVNEEVIVNEEEVVEKNNTEEVNVEESDVEETEETEDANDDTYYCMSFILHKLEQALLENETIREVFMNERKAGFEVSIKSTTGKTIKGTANIWEEE